MSKMMTYWSISSETLKQEAEILWLQVEILVAEKNLFFIRGHGREILFKSTDFWENSSLGKKISDDKELTYALLKQYQLPFPKTQYITKETLALRATLCSEMQYPLIIKPTDESHGNWVRMNIRSDTELHASLEEAFITYPRMIIQEQIIGEECRVLVLRGEVIYAVNRMPPSIRWDGISSIQALIDSENTTNPLRADDYHAPLAKIRVDSELESYIQKSGGYTLQSILAAWVTLQLRGNSNLWTGGTLVDVTDRLHESTKKICCSAASRLWLAICGVDIMTRDFSRPLEETGGVILEVNDTPGIGWDRELTGVNSGREILKRLFCITH